MPLDNTVEYVTTEPCRADEGSFYDINDPKTVEWLERSFPAIMSDQRSTAMSDGYQFMSSRKMIEALQNQFDLRLAAVSQQHSRQRDPRFQEHIMRFRLPNKRSKTLQEQLKDSIPEVLIMNSHNGRCRASAHIGVFRFVCANGMVVGDTAMAPARMRHFGENNTYEVFEGMLKKIGSKMTVMSRRISAMQEVELTAHDKNQFAKLCLKARKAPDWIAAKDVLNINRDEDKGDDLWRVFNVIQENLTNKVLSGVDSEGEPRQIRPLTGSRSQMINNAALWNSMEEFIGARKKFNSVAPTAEEKKVLEEA